MGFRASPKLQFYFRIVQLTGAITFLVAISYAGVHRGWWRNIDAALALGVITTVVTFAVTLHGIWIHHHRTPTAGSGKALFYARVGVEIFTILLWIATVVLMFQPKKGCQYRSEDRCSDTNDRNHIWPEYGDRPKISWAIGISFAIGESVSFILSLVTMLRGDPERTDSLEA